MPPLPTARHPLWLLSGFWLCVVIAIAVVLRRLVEFIRPSQGVPPQMASLNAAFSSHVALTLAHIIPAALFVLLAVAILHRRHSAERLETLFFPLGAITGVTAYAMSSFAIGGWLERSAVFVFNTWFLFSLARAWWFSLRRGRPPVEANAREKRRWLTRAVGVLLGIATTRPVMAVFFATSQRTHMGPADFFGIAFWIGFSVNTLVVELWLHRRPLK